MSGITFRHKGDFSKTEKFFNSLLKLDYLNVLERYGQAGVAALASLYNRKDSDSSVLPCLGMISSRALSDVQIGSIYPYQKRLGVAALASATPKDSGLTAASWDYEITHNGKETTIAFTNSNISNGVNIAIILQYGHGTKGGGYVAGRDYINPAIQPIFSGNV